ncbi:MAG: T9SS type A sorting domain-containing protein, partial [Chitinophagaceae bacterium]
VSTTSASLNGSATVSGGKITAYAWLQIAGPSTANIVSKMANATTVSALAAGTYTFELVAQDDRGNLGRDQITVNVALAAKPSNLAPVANAGADVSVTLPVNTATLNGAGSRDADGSITAYAWLKVSGPASFKFSNTTSATTSVSGLTQGTYVFELAVQDDKGALSRDQVTVTVAASVANQSSLGQIVAVSPKDINMLLPTNSTILTGEGSYSTGAKIVLYEWTKLSGPYRFNFRAGKSKVNPIINLQEGVYEFELKITDDKGRTATSRTKITVGANPNLTALSTSSALTVDYLKEDLTIYPVPTEDVLNFSYQSNNKEEQLTVRILDVSGRVVMQNTHSKNGEFYASKMNVSHLKPGVYFFQLDSKKVVGKMKKFIKK